MAGDPNNVEVWSDADVFIGGLTATNPTAGAAFALNATSGGTSGVVDKWDFVGLLDGSAGFAESQTNDSTDYNAWGVGVVATQKKNLAITRTFTCLESNPIALSLRYDVSSLTATGANYSGNLKGRDLNNKFKIGFLVQSGTLIERFISKNYAIVDSIGDATQGEDNIASFSVTVKIIPDASNIYWLAYKGTAS